MEPKRPGRTRGENGKRRHQHMFKRRVDTYQVRLAAINHYREHRNMDYTLAKFYPGVEGALRDTKRKSIYLWEKKRARIEEICTTTKGGQLKIVRDLGTATVLSHDAERKIVQWIGEMREQGAPVSAFMLKSKALDIAAEEGLPRDAFKTS
ncbi:hypothetical protein PC129_g14987 [Phytophthora cactorum]|uniref:HTH CENPB-type domain-containing protein n=1 Tax=Phytophthora cactorum TaxID=29920 RepID=A0A329RXT8_9STRA|nr:hypothetical protein Pcac1_g6756 [Phytophthora cactorum]KAG2804354.1 hypothetical protein PC111_g18291 [Phytophthora cactorum]KAG2809383.1 hypothetical protein PC112_g16531 [Phytophthora cactorum]KAG2850677.1 hypothetical protein PC113_g16571 [Phytophthora cactorum]KAG2893073.1 hypothetical protein PC115_g18590 [Phytophthora cactorum]